MNKIFKVKWNNALQAFTVCSELAKTHLCFSSAKTNAEKTVTHHVKLPLFTLSALLSAGLFNINNANAATADALPQNYFHVNTGEATQPTGNQDTNQGAVDAKAGARGKNALAAGVNAKAYGEGGVAIGVNATSRAFDAVAIGLNTSAHGEGGVAIGSKSSVAYSSVAIGKSSSATEESVAIGVNAKVQNINSSGMKHSAIAIGRNATTKVSGAIAIGDAAYTHGDRAISLGVEANATGVFSMAIGYNATTVNGMAVGPHSSAGYYAASFGREANASGSHSVAIGTTAKVDGHYAIAVGWSALASRSNAVALGVHSQATGEGGIAIGRDAKAQVGGSTIALGYSANATGSSAIAQGYFAAASKSSSVAIGYKSNSSGESAIAMGGSANASALASTAIGAGAKASGHGSYTLGYNAQSSGKFANAIGTSANASGEQSYAVGYAANASGYGAHAIGSSAKASNTDSYALGNYANTTAKNAYAIGRSAIASGEVGYAIGHNAASLGYGANAIGSYAKASETYSYAMGASANSSAQNAYAIGVKAVASGEAGYAIGQNAASLGYGANAIGSYAKASETYSYAMGASANSSAQNAYAIGVKAVASGDSGYAVGNNAQTSAKDAFAIGSRANANIENAVALGSNAVTTDPLTAVSAGMTAYTTETISGVAYKNFAGSKPFSVLSVGKVGQERRIQNVAAGLIAEKSTDAINGSQLYTALNVTNSEIKKSRESVKAGTNIVNIGETVNKETGAKEFTVNAKGTTVTQVDSSAEYLTVSPKSVKDNVTDYKVALTTKATDALKKADTALQTLTTSVNNQIAETLNKDNRDINFVNGSGTIARAVNGNITFDVAVDDSTIKIKNGKLVVVNQATNPAPMPAENYFHVNTGEAGQVVGTTATNKGTIDAKGGAIGNKSLAAGINAQATGDNAVAVGVDSLSALSSVAVGNKSKANGNESIAVGLESAASAWRTVAVGFQADANIESANAIGNQAKATGWGATALGTISKASGTNSSALGNAANASGSFSTAVGTSSVASGSYANALGTLSNAMGYAAVGLGLHSYASGQNSIAAGAYSVAENVAAIATGWQAGAYGRFSTAMGYNAKANSNQAIAFGTNSQSIEAAAIAIGENSASLTLGGIALGQNAMAGGSAELQQAAKAYFAKLDEYNTNQRVLAHTSQIAPNYKDLATKSLTLSAELADLKDKYTQAQTNAGKQDYAVAIGTNAKALNKDAVALGSYSATTAAVATDSATVNGIKYNGFVGTSPLATLSVGSQDVKRTITNVGAGRITPDSTDAINGSQLYQIVAQGHFKLLNAHLPKDGVNVKWGDTLNVIDGSGTKATVTTADNVNNIKYDVAVDENTIKIINGKLTATHSINDANTITDVKSGENIVISGGSDVNGVKTYTVSTAKEVKFDSISTGNISISTEGINAGNKKITNVADGDISPVSTDAVNGRQLNSVINAINKNVAGAKTELKAGTNIASVTSNIGSNGQTIYTVNADGVSVSAGSDAIKVTKSAKDANNVTAHVVDLAESTKADIQKGVDAHHTVANKGLTFNGDSGSTKVAKLGSTLNIKGDRNIKTSASANTVNVKLNDNISVKSVKAGNTTLDNDGVTIHNATTGKSVKLTQHGLNNGGNRISNVADGRADSDAVNMRQLNQVKSDVSRLDSKINRVEHKLRAGVAQANAVANIPQVTKNGGNGIGVGVANYHGESAVSIGYSGLSDNGKHIIKGSVSVDSRGSSGAGAGYMYQW
ncbi:TPA: YadA-like family protein [Mannheimia haemolytica]